MNTTLQDIIIKTLADTDHVCVPKLGTFLVRREPSKIDYQLGLAQPPSKEVVFNQDLISDDQVLRQRIIDKLYISEDDAKNKLDAFVESIHSELYTHGHYTLDSLGTLLLSNNHVRFEQDSRINLDHGSFGLPKVNFSKYLSQNQNLKLRPPMSKNEPIHSETTKSKKNRATVIWVSVIAPVVLSVTVMGFLWENRQNQSYASINPFFVPAKETLAVKLEQNSESFNYDDPMGRNTQADKVEQAEQVNIEAQKTETSAAVLAEAKESSEDDFPVDQEKLAKNTVVIKAGEIISGKSDRYYVICASYQTLKKAESVAKELEESGYEAVKIIEPHENVNRYRIALMDFEDQKEASAKAKELRPKHGNDIWVYKY